MKRWLLILAGLALALAASAQENILDRLKAANAFETLQASFTQTRHSSMLAKDLKSEGRVVLASPDRIRWEVLKPYPSLFVSSGEGDSFASLGMTGKEASLGMTGKEAPSGMTGKEAPSGMTGKGRRFRMPTEKDFTATVLEGEDLAVRLVPVRRDLKSLVREIIVHADKQSLRIQSALLITPDGDWTELVFKDFVVNRPVDDKLFEKQ